MPAWSVADLEARIVEVERRLALAEASATRYHDLIQDLDVVVWEADPRNNRFTFVSQRAESLLGYPLQRWLDEPAFLLNRIHTKDRELTLRWYSRLADADLPVSGEYRVIDASGRTVWVYGVARLVRDENGQPVQLRGALVDVSNRRQAEEAQVRLSAVLDATSDFVGVTDASGRILYVNRAGRKIMGAENPIGRFAQEFQTEATQQILARGALRTAINEGSWVGEADIRTPEGQVVPVSQVVVAHRDTQDKVDFYATIARDIRHQKQVEKTLSELLELAKDLSSTPEFDELLNRLQRRTAALLPCDRVATFYWDQQHNVLRDISRFGVPDEHTAYLEQMEYPLDLPISRALMSGQTVVLGLDSAESWMPTEILRTVGVECLLAVPLAVRGRVLGAFAAMKTTPGDRFSAEQVTLLENIGRHAGLALETAELYRAQREEAQIAAALARVGRELNVELNTPVVLERLCQLTTNVLECDASQTVLWRADEQVYVPVSGFGDSAEDWEETRLLRIPERLLGAVTDGLRREELVEVLGVPIDCRSRRQPVKASLYVALHRGDEMIGYQVARRRSGSQSFSTRQRRILRGIAQLGSMALENARLVGELERASRLKSDFVATMSHELRSPLNVIIGYNDLLMDGEFGDLSKEQNDAMRRVGKSAQELLELINATLNVSRLDTGRVPLDIRDANIGDIIGEVDAETTILRERPAVSFDWDIAPDLGRMRTDPVKVKVILKNLIGNALKFTERGTVCVAVRQRDGWVEFSVSDTGIGIAPALRELIFEAFRQADSSATRRHGGVGLGLYIVRRLSELLGGRVDVESEPGQGSRFIVLLPRDQTTRQNPPLED